MGPLLGPLSGLLQLVVFGLIVWAIVRAVSRGTGRVDAADRAVSVRRLFVYGLMAATLFMAATGATLVLSEIVGTSSAGAERAPLALGLALAIVAAPAYTLLLRYSWHRLREFASEPCSFGWIGYLNLSLLVSLVVTVVAAQQLLAGILSAEVEVETLVPVVVWGGVWAMHWFWLKAQFGLPGDLHLAAGSLTGLVTLALGAAGVAVAGVDRLYTGVVDRVPLGHEAPELTSWLAAAVVGGIVWTWHWLAHYDRAERTPLWHVYVLLIGVLGGLVTAVVAAATIGFHSLVWFVGDAASTLPSEHFEFLPVASGVLVVGAATWQYHRRVLQRREQVRTEALRTYDYLLAVAGLVASVIGAVLALIALVEAFAPPTGTGVANQLILSVTLVSIGAPLWRVTWSRVDRCVRVDPDAELRSIVRRIYLISLFGVGAAVALGSLVSVLFIGIEDLLEGTLGVETLRSLSVGLSLLVTVTGVAWYHFAVYRSDRRTLEDLAPAPAPMPPRHVILVAPRDPLLADEIATATGADIETHWRTDDATLPQIDLDALADSIAAVDDEDVLVVVGTEGPTVVPLEA